MAGVVIGGNAGEWCDGRTLGSDWGQEVGVLASVEMRLGDGTWGDRGGDAGRVMPRGPA